MVGIHYTAAVLFICVVKEVVGDTLAPPEISRSCKKIGICNDVVNYPTLLAKKLIQKLKDGKYTDVADDSGDDYYGSMKKNQQTKIRINSRNNFLDENEINSAVHYGSMDVQNRFWVPKLDQRTILLKAMSRSDSEDFFTKENNEIKLCESKVQQQIPKSALSRSNTWEYILNDDEAFQTFRGILCLTNDSCSSKLKPISNYGSKCVQKWIYEEMWYITKDEEVAKDYFRVPACCTCKLYHTNK